jgi:hypothetical protein
VLHSGGIAWERIFLDRQGNIVHTVRPPQSRMSWDLFFEAFRTELPETCYRQGMRVLSATDDGDTAAVMMEDGTEHLRPMSIIISTRLSMLSGGICVSGAKARNAT